MNPEPVMVSVDSSVTEKGESRFATIVVFWLAAAPPMDGKKSWNL